MCHAQLIDIEANRGVIQISSWNWRNEVSIEINVITVANEIAANQ
jgi:hypothetical protein